VTPKQFNCAWTIDNLPDSASLRRRLLVGIVGTLLPTDPICKAARQLLSHMDAFDARQQQLPLEAGGGVGDGHGDGGNN
jgi:hypothetical protein